ncbi:hypothetical protein M8R19_25830 [Pseudomonas sp. R3.Fl]|nr:MULTISPECIES: hypothetical protein [Pseudomonas]MCL6692115.1 hypothetical protein [Pseudomonas sp. R3.Fl]MDN6875732.1 hypothetical protein [Pseudomonas citronellolis]QOF85864.1 hypothetical protein IG194_03995 [Pseudomonas sp. ADPe]WRT80738.1 hypothetical protein VK748_20015 [Pseudomonas citronellolis]
MAEEKIDQNPRSEDFLRGVRKTFRRAAAVKISLRQEDCRQALREESYYSGWPFARMLHSKGRTTRGVMDAVDLPRMSVPALMEYLRAADGVSVSLERYLQVFAMHPETLAARAGVTCRELSHTPESAPVQAFIRDALRVVLMLAESGSSLDRVIFCFRNEPLPAFDYRTAEELVSAGKTDHVLQFIESWLAGAQG